MKDTDSAPIEVRLDAASIDAIARRVTELIGTHDANDLVSAREIAMRFGVSRAWVYENAAHLGAVRLGDGPRPRLRFDPELVADRFRATNIAAPSSAHPIADASPSLHKGDLIPIRGL